MDNASAWAEIKPLSKVTCTSYDCERDLHSFLKMRPRGASYRSEQCRACDVDLIDWHRLDRQDLSDIDHTFEALEREMIRHHFWHKKIDQGARDHALRKGLHKLRPAVEHRLRKYVALPQSQLFRDGTQTPGVGNVIYYAQHATATCCRKCIEAWHGVDREYPLSNREVEYMTELVMRYVNKRMPDLPLESTKVPRRKQNVVSQSVR